MKYDISLIFPSSPFLLDQQVFPPLGILYLAATARDWGYKVQVIDLVVADLQDTIKVKSDIVGVSLTTPQRDQAYRIAKFLKKDGNLSSDVRLTTKLDKTMESILTELGDTLG